MTVTEVIEKFRLLLPHSVSDQALQEMLFDCEKQVYKAMGFRGFLSVMANNFTAVLPDDIAVSQVQSVKDSTGGSCVFVPGKGNTLLLQKDGIYTVEYLPLPPKLNGDSRLAAGDLYGELYLYNLAKKVLLAGGDVAGYNNFEQLFAEQMQLLSRQKYGSAPSKTFRFSKESGVS